MSPKKTGVDVVSVTAALLTSLAFLLVFAFWAGITYIALHFIAKVW